MVVVSEAIWAIFKPPQLEFSGSPGYILEVSVQYKLGNKYHCEGWWIHFFDLYLQIFMI